MYYYNLPATHLSSVHEVHHGLKFTITNLHGQQDQWVLGGIVLQRIMHFIFGLLQHCKNHMVSFGHMSEKIEALATLSWHLWKEEITKKGKPVTFNQWCTGRQRKGRERSSYKGRSRCWWRSIAHICIQHTTHVSNTRHYYLSHLKEVPEVRGTRRQHQLVCMHLTSVPTHQCYIQQVTFPPQHAECVHQRAVVVVPQDAVLCALHCDYRTATQHKTWKYICWLTTSMFSTP